MINATISRICFILEERFGPFVQLATRCFLWDIFYQSGRLKLDYFQKGEWEAAVSLFKDVHPAPYMPKFLAEKLDISPYIPADLAAVMGTGGELILSTMLIIGWFGRVAAFGLLLIVGVIELSFQMQDVHYSTTPEHMMWALLLSFIVARGSGALSLDYIMRQKMIL